MLGTWRSKTSDLEVRVVKARDGVVWYKHPAWTGLCNCTEEVFLGSMVKVETPAKSPC